MLGNRNVAVRTNAPAVRGLTIKSTVTVAIARFINRNKPFVRYRLMYDGPYKSGRKTTILWPEQHGEPCFETFGVSNFYVRRFSTRHGRGILIVGITIRMVNNFKPWWFFSRRDLCRFCPYHNTTTVYGYNSVTVSNLIQFPAFSV